MRIAKYGDAPAKQFLELREKANDGCSVCPCCGQSPIRKYAYRNITNELRVDCYRCNMCGAEWESELYPYCDSSVSEVKADIVYHLFGSLCIERIEFSNDTVKLWWSALSTRYRGMVMLMKDCTPDQVTYEVTGLPAEYHSGVVKAVLSLLGNKVIPTGASLV